MRPESITTALHHLIWPIALVGVKGPDKHNLMTVAMITQVSVNPLLVLVSISPGRYTHDILVQTGEFVVSILTTEQKDLSSFCGFRSGRDIDKIAQLGLKTTPSTLVQVPRLADCLANLECKVVDRHPTGDHTLFIGEVVAADVAEEELEPLFMYLGRTVSFGSAYQKP